jgi:hypothetical protein
MYPAQPQQEEPLASCLDLRGMAGMDCGDVFEFLTARRPNGDELLRPLATSIARIDRYFVWASASSGLNSIASGVPRLTVVPNSTRTLVIMPPTMETTFTSRYASAITVPGS